MEIQKKPLSQLSKEEFHKAYAIMEKEYQEKDKFYPTKTELLTNMVQSGEMDINKFFEFYNDLNEIN